MNKDRKMRPKVYLETSVVSYLAARPSRDLVVAANQEVTREWWANAQERLDLFLSEIVLKEIAAGDRVAAAERKRYLVKVPLLPLNLDARALADRYLAARIMPAKAATDALHIALATVHGMDYVVTWNCAHIANALTQKAIARISSEGGYEPPVICTPLELMEDEA